jgi:hypothetical protein
MQMSLGEQTSPAGNGWQDNRESRAAQISAKAYVEISELDETGFDLPGGIEGGRSRRNGQ